MLFIILITVSCTKKDNKDTDDYNKEFVQESINNQGKIIKDNKTKESSKNNNLIEENLSKLQNDSQRNLDENVLSKKDSDEVDQQGKSKAVELQPLDITIHLSTQNKDTNILLPNKCKLPKVHWSDKLLVEIKPINNIKLSDELIKRFNNLYPETEYVKENNSIKMLVVIEDSVDFNIRNEDINLIGYCINENVSIEHGYSKMEYNLIRYNKEHTRELLYTSDIVDDYLNLDIIFEEIQDHEAIEAALIENLVGLDKSKQLPEVRFSWKDEYTLNMFITNIEQKVEYYINFNGYIQTNGAIYYEVFSHSQVFEGLYSYGCYPGIYEFYRLPKQKIVDFNINSFAEKQIGIIENYSFNIGPIWQDINKIILGTYDEWGYYTFIYDYVNNKLLTKDAMHTFEYENIRKKDKFAFVLLESQLLKIDMQSSKVVSKIDIGTLDISAIKYNENINQLIALRYDNDKKSYCLMLLNENLDIISDGKINHECIDWFYSINTELYWVDDEHIAIDLRGDTEINTCIYNIKTGNRSKIIPNEKIMSISPNYEYMVFIDVETNSLKVRDRNYEIIGEATFDNDIEIPKYQYYDFWYDNNFYIDLGDLNEMFIWEMESLKQRFIKLPYKNTAILEIVDDATIRIVTDADNIEKGEFYGM